MYLLKDKQRGQDPKIEEPMKCLTYIIVYVNYLFRLKSFSRRCFKLNRFASPSDDDIYHSIFFVFSSGCSSSSPRSLFGSSPRSSGSRISWRSTQRISSPDGRTSRCSSSTPTSATSARSYSSLHDSSSAIAAGMKSNIKISNHKKQNETASAL